MKNIILYSALTVILGWMVFFGVKAYHQAILYEEATTELVTYQGAEQQAVLQLEKLAKSLLGGFYNDETKIAVDEIMRCYELMESG